MHSLHEQCILNIQSKWKRKLDNVAESTFLLQKAWESLGALFSIGGGTAVQPVHEREAGREDFLFVCSAWEIPTAVKGFCFFEFPRLV